MNDQIFIEEGEETLRLDQVLAKRFQGHYSRTYFQHLISQDLVLVNGLPVKKRLKPRVGDEIEIEFAADQALDLTPEPIPLNIIYEDDDLLVINKPPGLVVHPAPGNWTGTFVNALLYHCQGLKEQGSLRPGIVHRLDKDTSGVLIAAKNSIAQRLLIAAFAGREVYKSYIAITLGNPGDRVVEEPIGRHPVHRQKMTVLPSGRYAKSILKTVKKGKELSCVQIILETGRTHQIRVHLSYLGMPVLGDSLYGKQTTNRKWKADRQLLHAEVLRLKHPLTGKEMEFQAPLPVDIQTFINQISLD